MGGVEQLTTAMVGPIVGFSVWAGESVAHLLFYYFSMQS
jgi:hypothetical protein